MAKATKDMTKGTIWKHIVLFALPLFLGNLFQQLYNTVDALIVGNFIGDTALAAVTSCGSITFFMIGFFAGVSTGAGVIVSRFFGAHDYDNLKKTVHTIVAFGLIAGTVMTVLGVLLVPFVLKLMQVDEAVMPYSVSYLRIYFAGALSFIMYNTFVGILQAVGDSKHPLYYLIISSVLNAVLDLLFVGVFKMGVAGAALATIIGQFVSAILCFIRLVRTRDVYKLTVKEIKIDGPLMKEIIKIGLPAGVQNSIISFANIIVQSYINMFGAAAMAGVGTASKLEGFVFLPINCFTMAITTFVGQNLGAKEYARAKKGSTFGIITTLVLAEALGIIEFFLAPNLISLFAQSEEAIAYGVAKARTSCFFYFLLAFSHCIAAVLRGAGKSFVPMLVMMVCWCFIRVLFLMITVPLTHDIRMLYIIYPITWGLSGIYFLFYYLKGNWLHGKDNQQID